MATLDQNWHKINELNALTLEKITILFHGIQNTSMTCSAELDRALYCIPLSELSSWSISMDSSSASESEDSMATTNDALSCLDNLSAASASSAPLRHLMSAEKKGPPR